MHRGTFSKLLACSTHAVQECAGLAAAGHGGDGGVLEEEAGRAHLDAASSTLISLPPHDWVEAQVGGGLGLGRVDLRWPLHLQADLLVWALLIELRHSVQVLLHSSSDQTEGRHANGILAAELFS